MDLLHEVVHESLQRDVVGENSLRRHASTVASCCMCRGRVELGQEEARLGPTGITDDEPGQWEAFRNEFLCLCQY
jgi:hypothetical protein